MVDTAELDQFARAFHERTAAGLPIVGVPAGERFIRIIQTKYASGLGVGFGSTRFSDPRYIKGDPTAHLFSTLYATTTVDTAFDEAVLRDLRDGVAGEVLISRAELQLFDICVVRVVSELRLVNLTHPSARRIGVPTDVTGYSQHHLSQRYAYALHCHPDQPDGVFYRSRFTHEFNIAVFDRAIDRCLTQIQRKPLLKEDLRQILRDRNLSMTRARPIALQPEASTSEEERPPTRLSLLPAKS